MRKDPATRFCIVGAGAAGLTAAETLKEMGYTNVTLLEKEASAGGKCCSIEYEGRPYELGAGIISANNQTILDLAQKTGVPLSKVDFGDNNLYDIETGGVIRDILSPGEKIPFLWQLLLKYRRLCMKYRNITKPGLAGVDPELCINFKDWAELHGIELVQKNFERFFTGFGYGFWQEIPAAYVLKYYDWNTLKSFIRRGFFTFPEGIQNLWKEVAKGHEVRYNTDIQYIDRQKCVRVTSNQGSSEFDVLLLSCPLDEALSFLNGNDAEKILFSRIRYNDYQTYACFIDGFPQQTGFIPAHFYPSEMGKPVFWYKRYADSNFYTLYVQGDWLMSEKQITDNIKTCIKKLGGTLKNIYSISRWKYFPHVDTEGMKNGFFDKLEDQQGLNRTYYIGELLNFSTVELSAGYAKNLVEKYF